jgi:hypothetical protein
MFNTNIEINLFENERVNEHVTKNSHKFQGLGLI